MTPIVFKFTKILEDVIVSSVTLSGILFIFLLLFIQYHWNRRALYSAASKVHGPKGLPLIGYAHKVLKNPEGLLETFTEVTKAYPGLTKVWFANKLVFLITEPNYLDIVLNSSKALAKEPYIYRYLDVVNSEGLLTLPVPMWKIHRKHINPTFNSNMLAKFMKIFIKYADMLVNVLNESSVDSSVDTSVDINSIMNRCTLDIICETTMGIEVNALKHNNNYIEWIERLSQIIYKRILILWYHWDFIFDFSSLKKELTEIIDNITCSTKNLIKQKRDEQTKKKASIQMNNTEPSSGKSFIDLMFGVSANDITFSDDDIEAELHTLVMAGFETTSTVMCFLLTMFGMHPDIQRKVYEEVIEVVGPTKPVENDDLPYLKYTTCAIKETLRLFSPAPILARAITEDLDLGENILPAGSIAVICIYCTHRDPKYWQDPLTFNPDRFLEENLSKIPPCAFIPFLTGPRNCIGEKYAMKEMVTIIATLVRKFMFFTSYKSVEEIELLMHIILRPKDGFKLSLKRRV